jgi:phenylpropionate dioxygenase-like ring-hydroxylating dioxygenase large terminal subunit
VGHEENELLTRVGPGTPGGELLRRYWQPAALAEELPMGGAPVPVRLLGEDLVLFRDDDGRPGLLGIHCPHRGADLSYGRLEDGGLRCIYHGWLFDVTGRCLEQPGEPAGSTFHERIRQRAYPCVEQAGLIFAYLGPGAPPLLPAYDFLTMPDDHRFVTKTHQECNYLQGNEGNIDPVHLSFLHRINSDTDAAAYTAGDLRPTIDIEETSYGVRIYSVRTVGADQRYVRVSNFVMPNLAAVPGGGNGFIANWHVPIDDTNHWRFDIRVSVGVPMDREAMLRSRTELTPDYRMVRNRANRYLQDREEMKTRTYSGMGMAFQAHDKCITEGEGPIQDRTQEHLGSTDRAIMLQRRLLLKAIEDVRAGRDPLHVLRSSAEVPELVVRNETIPESVDWHRYWEHGAELEGAIRVVDRATAGRA